MVNLLTGPKGSGKTQQMIALANDKLKTTNGNVVLIKKSHQSTIDVDFNIRAICMEDYSSVSTLDGFVGFLYGMVAENHDIESIFIDGVLKLADINLDNLSDFMQKVSKISKENDIEFYISISAEKEKIADLDNPDYKVLN